MKSLEIVNKKINYCEEQKVPCVSMRLVSLQQIKQDLERLQKQDDDIKSGELSDGYHTFNDLYYQRCILFATLVNQNKKTSWKSYKHEDGELCFGGGWFIVGIDTPLGSYTYHYENKYWDLFQCKELEKGKHWDGHTSKDVDRLLSIKNEDLERYELILKRLYLTGIENQKIKMFDINGYDNEDLQDYIKLKDIVIDSMNDWFFEDRNKDKFFELNDDE